MLNRILFLGSLVISLSLVFLVIFAPSLEPVWPGWSAPVTLFAQDLAVRRTAIACAIGVAVSAVIFFRTPKEPRLTLKPEEKSTRRPRSRNTIGA